MEQNLNPLVSVIMPCLNAQATISDSIQSIINQTYQNIELIIIDDGSSDSTISIVQTFISDPRILLLRNNGNKGVSFARNLGITVAKGKYICFLDSDDLLSCDSIKLRVALAEDKAIDVVYGAYHRMESSGSCYLIVPPKKVSYTDMLRRNYIPNLTGFYNVVSLGKRLQKNVRHEDYLMWILMLRDVKFAYSVSSYSLGVYRVSNSSLSGNKFKAFHWHWIILRKELKIPVIRAYYYQLFYFLSSIFIRLFSKRVVL